MKKHNFEKLIQAITKRPLLIDTQDEFLTPQTEYYIYKVLPLTERKVFFVWKTPKKIDNFFKSFITAFVNKYKEPNPRAYDCNARTYGERAKWENKSPEEQERAHFHHSSNMFSKQALLEQIETNFLSSDIKHVFCRYGFYATHYGIGIFAFYATTGVLEAIRTLKEFLNQKYIPYKNEFSEARWVLRFKIGLDKEKHESLINQLNA